MKKTLHDALVSQISWTGNRTLTSTDVPSIKQPSQVDCDSAKLFPIANSNFLFNDNQETTYSGDSVDNFFAKTSTHSLFENSFSYQTAPNGHSTSLLQTVQSASIDMNSIYHNGSIDPAFHTSFNGTSNVSTNDNYVTVAPHCSYLSTDFVNNMHEQNAPFIFTQSSTPTSYKYMQRPSETSSIPTVNVGAS